MPFCPQCHPNQSTSYTFLKIQSARLLSQGPALCAPEHVHSNSLGLGHTLGGLTAGTLMGSEGQGLTFGLLTKNCVALTESLHLLEPQFP